MTTVPVLAAPLFDPGTGRIDVETPAGLSLAQIVARVLPELTEAERLHCRITLVTPAGSWAIEPLLWHAVKPHAGVRVVIRVIPGKSALRSVLMIAVQVAAVALGGPLGGWAANTFGGSTALWTAAATLGINVLGSLLVNALVPPPQPSSREEQPSYAISGWRNRFEPDGAVPVVLGTMRYAPPFAAASWTEIVGDWQYVRAIFTFGYGPVEISDLRLGETPLDEFDEIDLEIREGRPGDALQSISPRQVIEETIGVDLTRPKPRDDLGDVTSDEGVETPVVRTTGDDASGASIIIAFPAGLVKMNDEGEPRSQSVRIRIERRLAGETDWQSVETLDIRASQTEAFYRQYSWDFPVRGRWEIRLTRMTTDSTSATVSDRANWVVLQTIRPEYPIAWDQPLALLAIRIKATHQLSGSLDNLSALVRAPVLDYDAQSGNWIERPSSNPASIYRHVLQSPANPRPVANAGIDLDQLESWHDFCRLNGLTYNAVLDQAGTTLREVLLQVTAAGRATPRHDGMKWGVTIDRPQELVIDHISPRNSWNFRVSRSYVRPPDGLRVKFLDATNDYAETDRLIEWLDHTGPVELTELLEMPGKTDPDEIWREATRRALEAKYRPDTYEVMQNAAVRVATRGDLVRLSHDVLDDTQRAARVKSVHGDLILLDEALEIVAGENYGIRFRVFDHPNPTNSGNGSPSKNGSDTIGRSVIRAVSAREELTDLLTLTGDGDMPVAGDLILFGRISEESREVIVTGVEQGEDLTCLIRMVDAAPEIDAELATMTPPPWTGRVGWIPPEGDLPVPAAPVWLSIRSGAAAYSDFLDQFLSADRSRRQIVYRLKPGTGAALISGYRIRHRLAGSADWTVLDIPAANGGGNIDGYDLGDTVELMAEAVSFAGMAGTATSIVQIVVGSADAPIPAGISDERVSIETLPGGVRIRFANEDPATKSVRLYRSLTDTLDRQADREGDPVPAPVGREAVLLSGDLTRQNLLADHGGFDTDAGWEVDTAWTISNGRAEHDAGTSAQIHHSLRMADGQFYRVSWTAGGSFGSGSAARVRAELNGSLSDDAGPWRTQPGRYTERLKVFGGSAGGLTIDADDGFGGTVDDIALYAETAACLPLGINYFWIEPLNADGSPGPVVGPFTATIE